MRPAIGLYTRVCLFMVSSLELPRLIYAKTTAGYAFHSPLSKPVIQLLCRHLLLVRGCMWTNNGNVFEGTTGTSGRPGV